MPCPSRVRWLTSASVGGYALPFLHEAGYFPANVVFCDRALFNSASFLVTHGSRDPRPQAEMQQLMQFMVQQLPYRIVPPLITAGALELHPLPLHQQILQFGQQAIAAGHRSLQVVPLFLLPGVHVMEDIPAEVAIARQSLELPVEVTPHLGNHPRLPALLNPPSLAPGEALILLAHGSRRQGGNAPVEAIAHSLTAFPAFWSLPPDLETQVATLVQAGKTRITVLPYFLFAGGITDAIAQQVTQLAARFPQVSLTLLEPLGATAALAEIVLEQMQAIERVPQ